VTFTATATTTDPAGTYTATTTVTFSVFEVVSLKPEQGFPLANTTTYQLCQKQNAVVKVNAVANPPVATDAALPSSGWDLVNVSTHSVQSSTTVSLSQVATYTVSCTDGTSTKSITISVVAPPTPPGLDTDYDGICDCQEMLDGTDPTSASSMGSVGLSFFTFNQSSLSGAQSQTPRTETLNTRTVTGKVDTAVQIDSQSTAILAYDESNYNNNGRLNINLQQGTVRFYFKPDWLSSISNGTGPGQGNSADSRLVEVGSNTGGNSDQWWAITISPDGNQLSLKTRNGATTTLAVSAPIAWAANEWHQVCLTYSSAGSAIYIDGVAKTTGAAVASVPSSTVRTNGFRIGSDASGNNQARGIVDQFEVFNTVLSSADIFAAFTASQNASQPLNSCNLYPIAFPQATYTANQIVVVTLQNSLPGNFGWLHWNGNDSSMTPSDLATSLTAPGNSSTYQNPKVFGDTVINVGDKIKGDTGVERAKAVINALNGLVGQTIDLPVCTYDNLGNDKGLYTVAGYAHVLFQSYNFNGSQKTMTFKYLQAQSCELTPQCQVPTLTAVNTLSGAIEDTPFDIPFDSLAAAATTADVDGPLPTLFKLVNVTSGSLAVRLDTTHTQTVNPGDVFDAGQTWVWTPAANANGTLNAFTIKAWDRCVASATAVQVSISVTPVNDCPTLDILNSLTINEDAAAQAVNLTGIGPGPNESGQVLTVTASSSNPGLIPNPTVTYTSPNPTGTLNFAPVANQFGSATITVSVQDNGGTASGGCNTFSRSFIVTVNSVNDCPTLDIFNSLTINEDAGLQTVNITGIGPGPNETGQVLTVTASSGNPALIPNPTVTYTSPNPTGTLNFTPVANQFGSATITVTVQDNGGTANGGCNTFSRTFIVTVNSVNDCPTLDILNPLTINEDAGAQTVNLTGIGPGPNESGQVLTITASSGNPALIPTPTVTYASPNPTGILSFAPLANQSGSATITVIVQDDGGTANGGCNTISRTFTVTVNPVNDPPIVDAGQNLSIYSSLSVDLTGTFQDPDGDPPRNIIWSVVSGPPNIVPISYSPNASSLATRATVPTPGIYLFALQASDAQFTASDTVTISFYPDTAPIVDAGPDQRIPRNSTAHLRGSTSIGSLPPGSTVVTTWTTLSGASISQDPNNKLNATSSLSVAGIYTFTLTVTKQWTDAGGNPHLLSGSDDVLVTVADACSRKYTRNADFAEGTLVNVNYTNVPGQLHLNSSISPFSFVNVPCPGRGTVVRIDANTGHILGEYWTAPNGRNREGFRVAVDRLGNTWVANYSEDTLSGGINMGSIMEIGVVIGGTRTDGTKDGLGRYVYRSDGQYLAPPFAYNTCKDRNGDGLIKTSMGLGNKLDWNLNSAGSDIDGASLADDECILRYIRVAPWHIGTLALDKNNNVWTGGYGQSAVSDLSLQKLNVNVDPPTLEAAITTINCGGYYGFIDSHGVLWSTLLGSGVLRWDLSLPATDAQCFLSDDLGNWLGLARFVAPDPNTGQIWGTFSNDPGVVKANPDGMPSGATYLFDDGYYWAQGLVVDGNHNVWVAHGAERGTTVGHLTTGGDFIGNVELPCGKGTGYPALDLPIDGYDSAPNIFSGAGPQIISVGSDGKIWVVNVNRNNAMRIDPAAGPLGGMRQDTRVGAVDQVVDLGQQAFFVPEQAQLYNFIAGDMTGFITVGSTAPSGSWTVVHDSKNSGQTWGRVSWTGVEDVASGATISVEVRAADLQLGLTTKSFSAVANGTDFNAMGQFIEIRVTLSKGAGSVQPILTDLTVSCGGPPPAFPADTTPSIAQDDSKVVLRDTADNLIDVLANDLTKSDPAWLIASVSPAHSGVVLNNLTNLSYTPSPGFFGRDAFSYTIDNGNNSPSRALVNIEVLRPSAAEPITTRDDMFTISANSGHISLDLTGNDYTPASGLLLIIDFTVPLHGSINDRDSDCGHLWYTPQANYIGTDAFTYKVTDGLGNAGVGNVIINIVPAPAISCQQTVLGVLSSSDPVSKSIPPTFGSALFAYGPINYSDTYAFTATPAGQTVTFTARVAENKFRPLLFVRNDLGAPFNTTGVPSLSVPIPSGASGRTYTIEVISSDPLQIGTYTLTADCQQSVPGPKLQVLNGDVTVPTSVDLDLGIVTKGGARSVTLEVFNVGSSTLSLGAVQITPGSGRVNPDFFLASTLPASLAPGEESALIITIDTASSGAKSSTLSFSTSDPNASNFSLHLIGFVNETTPASGSISIFVPGANRVYAAPATVTIRAAVSSPQTASFVQVDFIATSSAGRFVWHSFSLPPYSYQQVGVPVGNYILTALGYDSAGFAYASTPIPISVIDPPGNLKPIVNNDEATVGVHGTITIPVLANDVDPNGDVLTIDSFTPAQFGTVALATGNTALSYTHTGNGPAVDGFSYIASDGKGGYSRGYVSVNVISGTTPCVSITAPLPGTITSWPSSGIVISASACPGVQKVEFFSGCNNKIGERVGAPFDLTWNEFQSGIPYQLWVKATDGGGNVAMSSAVALTFQTVAGNHPPSARIDQPSPNLVVRDGKLSVKGRAWDQDTIVTYTLKVLNLDGQLMASTTVNRNVVGTTLDNDLGTLDLTSIRNGTYDLQLSVNDGSETVFARVAFALSSELKIGQLTFSQQDITIPINGLSVSLVRTYDSLNPNTGDFGYSWTYSLYNLEVELDENRDPATDLDDEDFSLRSGGGRDITLTLPNGQRTTFVFNLRATGDPESPWQIAEWLSAPGVTAKLETTVDNRLITLPSGLVYWQAAGSGTPIDSFDFPAFTLTTDDGTQYVIARENLGEHFLLSDEGSDSYVESYGNAFLKRIVTPARNIVEIDKNSITQIGPAGAKTPAMLFDRDTQQRIVAVYDPASLESDGSRSALPAIKYEYDSQGNLVRVLKLKDRLDESNPVYEILEYRYGQAGFPHYIKDIIGPQGSPNAHTEYYSNPNDPANYGKIQSITDAKGRVTSFVHATSGFATGRPAGYGVPVAREEITFAPVTGMSQVTVHEADARGNIIYSKDALSLETWSKFATRGSLLSTDPQYLSSADQQSDVELLMEQQYTVSELQNGISVPRTYFRTWEYHGTGTAAQELAPTIVTDLHVSDTPAGKLRTTRSEYDSLGQVTKTYDPNNSQPGSGVYHETKYDETLGSITYGQVTGQYFHGTDPVPVDPVMGQPLSQTVFITTLADPVGGQLWYSVDAQNTATVYEYYRGETGGRLGDIKSLTVRSPGYTGTPLSKTAYTYDPNGNRLTEERVQFQRDNSGTVIVDANGTPAESGRLITRYEYDAQGRPTKTTDATGATSETTYNSIGKGATSTDRFNATTTYYYDRGGDLSGTGYPDGTVSYQATYYQDGRAGIGLLRFTVVEDRHVVAGTGPVTGTRTVYNSVDRVIRSERVKNLVIGLSVNGEVNDTVYDTTQPCIVLSRTLTEYLADGRVSKTAQDIDLDGTISAGDPVTSYEYSSDGLTHTTHVSTVNDGTATLKTDAIQEFDLNGNSLNSQTRSYYNDALQSFRPQIRQQYDQLNRSKSVASYTDETSGAAGVTMASSRYDWLGRAWLRIDADNHGTAYIYDAAGRVSWVVTDVDPSATLPGSPLTTRAAWLTWAQAARTSSDSTATKYEYDDLGQQTTQTDGNGHATHFSYDALGRRTARYLPNDSTLSGGEHWFYDWDEVTGLTITGSSNPKRPNVVRHVDFNGQEMRLRYDLVGRLSQKKSSATAVLVDYYYTAVGQRSRMIDNQSSSISSPRETRYVYDEQSRLRIKNTPEATLTYDYDPAGNMQTISARKGYAFPALPPYTLANVAAAALDPNPAGAYMTYIYDVRHRLAKVNPDNLNGTGNADVSYAYDPVGNQATMTYRNGVTTTYQYNTRNQLRWLRAASGSGTVASFDYDDYDSADGLSWPPERQLLPSGQRRGLAELLVYNGQNYRRVIAWDVDNLNRLRAERIRNSTGANWPAWAPTAVPTTPAAGDLLYDVVPGNDSAGYDPVGNRPSRSGSGISLLTAGGPVTLQNQNQPNMVYDANDRLNYVSSPASSDANGNTLYQSGYVSQQTQGQVVPNSTHVDAFDIENRLVQRSDGSTVVTLIYDGDGNRVVKHVDAPGTVNDSVTYFLMDDRNPTGYAQVLEERASLTGDPTVKYVYGFDLVSQAKSAATYYYGYDALGNVRYLTDGVDGHTTDTYTYDAFGILLDTTDTASPPKNVYRYTGEQWDPQLGMYHLRARYYHPDAGRFWTMDTYERDQERPGADTDSPPTPSTGGRTPSDGGEDQENPLSLHKYLYCANNPINAIDPSGQDFELVAVTLVIGALGGLDAQAGPPVTATQATSRFRVYVRADGDHAWIYVENTITGEKHTYSRWKTGYGKPAATHSGVLTDKELKRGFAASRGLEVKSFTPTINAGYGVWGNNCATYAQSEWKRVSGESLKKSGPFASGTYDLPSVLKDSILDKNGGKKEVLIEKGAK